MNPPGRGVPGIDPGLLARFRASASQIAWRPPEESRSGARATSGARIAFLRQETARIEERGGPGGDRTVVESGPVGALWIILEADRRGEAPQLSSFEGGVDPAFPAGAIVARWGAPGGRSSLELDELVDLARYALA